VKLAIISIIVVTAIASIVRVQRLGIKEGMKMSLTILGIGGLLIAPVTGTYHYLVLLLPVGLFLSSVMRGTEKMIGYVVLGLHAAIGFIPYSLTRQFDGQGILTLLAYPRLIALSMLYALIIAIVWTTVDRGQEPNGVVSFGG